MNIRSNMRVNPLTQIDFYKADHRRQYPAGTEMVYSNFTPRSTRHAPKVKGVDDKIVFAGLQPYIKWFLMAEFDFGFFLRDQDEVVRDYKRRLDNALGKDAVPVEHIRELHELGVLPLSIRALPEGTVVDAKTPLFTIHNTGKKFFWLVNYLETSLSNMVWKTCTSATTAYKYKQLLTKWANHTGANKGFIPFQAHDFSFRGMNGPMDAMTSGAGHLFSFVGTDTVSAIDFMEEFYNANSDKELIGCSVPATEHSVMCMGTKDGEFDTFKRLITEIYPTGIVSIVSDSFDFWQVISDFLPRLKNIIMARKGGPVGDKVVIRPDSGDPVEIICGEEIYEVPVEDVENLAEAKEYAMDVLCEKVGEATPHGQFGDPDPSMHFKYDGKTYLLNVSIDWNRYDKQFYYMDGSKIVSCEEVTLTPEQKGAIECLWDIFGGTLTDKGFKQLDSHIGLIYGDSITLERCDNIMRRLAAKGFASDNVVLGVGSYTYTYVTRDTYGFAMKATAGIVNGEVREIFKDPKTDSGLKKSARGFIYGWYENGELKWTDQAPMEKAIGPNSDSAYVEIFRDGHLIVDHKLQDIRNRINDSVEKALNTK